MRSLKQFLEQENINKAMILTVLVAALGYMVDVFDLLLFSIVRLDSLRDMGYSGDDLLHKGIFLINMQMTGLLLGGIFWGMWGDRLGRVSVLFGSILLYSLANIANGFANSVETYAVLRLLAGIGLAGELGAGVTLASELIPRRYRGLGTTFIATIGVSGAVLAAVVAEYFDWRTAYVIGGGMGIVLLLFRMNVAESGLYKKIAAGAEKVTRGDFMMILNNPGRLKRYVAAILVGAPTWAIVGLFITFAPEFAAGFGMTDIPETGRAVLFCYSGIVAGDALSGLLSQYLRSRRKAIALWLGLTIVFIGLYVVFARQSVDAYYWMCFLMGIGGGYWAMFIQMGAEQFGTNIRATAATSIPNMVRGLTIPMTIGFRALIPSLGVPMAGVAVAGTAIVLAYLALWSLKETFDRDLDFIER